jgi:hypothetical protein
MSELAWYEACSADRDHQDVEVDLDAIGNPGDARWAHVADEGTGGPFRWYIYRHWHWDDIDNDPDALLAGGQVASMDEGKAAVAAWVTEARNKATT